IPFDPFRVGPRSLDSLPWVSLTAISFDPFRVGPRSLDSLPWVSLTAISFDPFRVGPRSLDRLPWVSLTAIPFDPFRVGPRSLDPPPWFSPTAIPFAPSRVDRRYAAKHAGSVRSQGSRHKRSLQGGVSRGAKQSGLIIQDDPDGNIVQQRLEPALGRESRHERWPFQLPSHLWSDSSAQV